jgi:hypothetical protein
MKGGGCVSVYMCTSFPGWFEWMVWEQLLLLSFNQLCMLLPLQVICLWSEMLDY